MVGLCFPVLPDLFFGQHCVDEVISQLIDGKLEFVVWIAEFRSVLRLDKGIRERIEHVLHGNPWMQSWVQSDGPWLRVGGRRKGIFPRKQTEPLLRHAKVSGIQNLSDRNFQVPWLVHSELPEWDRFRQSVNQPGNVLHDPIPRLEFVDEPKEPQDKLHASGDVPAASTVGVGELCARRTPDKYVDFREHVGFKSQYVAVDGLRFRVVLAMRLDGRTPVVDRCEDPEAHLPESLRETSRSSEQVHSS
jgi:hypothetical protein